MAYKLKYTGEEIDSLLTKVLKYDGTNSASGSSARELYIDFTGQGLTDEAKAYNAETFTILQNEKIFIYISDDTFYCFALEYENTDTNIAITFNPGGAFIKVELYPNGETVIVASTIGTNGILFLDSSSTNEYKNLNSSAYSLLKDKRTERVVIQYMGNIYYPVGVIRHTPYVDFTCIKDKMFMIIRVHSDGEIEKINE